MPASPVMRSTAGAVSPRTARSPEGTGGRGVQSARLASPRCRRPRSVRPLPPRPRLLPLLRCRPPRGGGDPRASASKPPKRREPERSTGPGRSRRCGGRPCPLPRRRRAGRGCGASRPPRRRSRAVPEPLRRGRTFPGPGFPDPSTGWRAPSWLNLQRVEEQDRGEEVGGAARAEAALHEGRVEADRLVPPPRRLHPTIGQDGRRLRQRHERQGAPRYAGRDREGDAGLRRLVAAAVLPARRQARRWAWDA